ncbi:MAG TPA: hypothetical protein VGR45_10370 [Stellaceae bacterium]|nr:hypothetical protein [Stellaceae bacterium]
MTIAAADFRTYVVEPALGALVPAGVPYSLTAADLLMATAAVESCLGSYLMQCGGPAIGVFQIEPASLANLWAKLTPRQLAAMRSISTPQSPVTQIATNLVFAAAICRLFYWHDPMPLPPHTANGLWSMYKPVWNSAAGATTEPEFMAALGLTDIVFQNG